MFAFGIRYLNGWSMAAADGAKKERPEWPPHPDRVFMALAAAWFETGEDAEEGHALRRLESLGPPDLRRIGAAGTHHESPATFRSTTRGSEARCPPAAHWKNSRTPD